MIFIIADFKFFFKINFYIFQMMVLDMFHKKLTHYCLKVYGRIFSNKIGKDKIFIL